MPRIFRIVGEGSIAVRGIIFRCLKRDLQDFGDFLDSCDRLMLVQRTLLASVERVVCWGAIGWDVFGGGIAGRIHQSFRQ